MGTVKRQQLEELGLHSYIEDLLKETGVFVQACRRHESYVYSYDDKALKKAHRLARRRLCSFETSPDPYPWRLVAEAIDRVSEESPMECWDCANSAKD
jgi:hypothetical protein